MTAANPQGTATAGAGTGGWLERSLPPAALPYARLARLDKPIGTWLLLWPCWWGLALASSGVPSLWFILLFGIGAIVMRGAGCTVNDLADRDFDARVARTRTRPLASGALTPRQAFVFLALQLLLGFLVLIQFNAATIALGVASLPLIVIYPFMKRFTYWPQAFLGITFNWGALVGWTAVTGELGWPATVLYLAGFCWTLGYDTIYAHQDKEDDALIGVKSSALKLGERTKPYLVLFYAAALALLAVAGWLAGLGAAFYLLLPLAAAHAAWQIARVDIDGPATCLAIFKSNRDFGLLVAAAILAGHLPVGS
jgi:4-hydroxybenzoate polyprenyltransferase